MRCFSEFGEYIVGESPHCLLHVRLVFVYVDRSDHELVHCFIGRCVEHMFLSLWGSYCCVWVPRACIWCIIVIDFLESTSSGCLYGVEDCFEALPYCVKTHKKLGLNAFFDYFNGLCKFLLYYTSRDISCSFHIKLSTWVFLILKFSSDRINYFSWSYSDIFCKFWYFPHKWWSAYICGESYSFNPYRIFQCTGIKWWILSCNSYECLRRIHKTYLGHTTYIEFF